jgi:hypothetical protein
LFSLDEVAVHVCHAIPGGYAFAIERWSSPDKFSSISPPADWRATGSKGAAGSSYAFTSPDRKAEIRISATYHLELPSDLPDDVLGVAFAKERGLAPIQRIRGTGWDGLQREYADSADGTRSLGFAARRDSTAVLLTMKAPSKDFDGYRSIFEEAARPLKLGE